MFSCSMDSGKIFLFTDKIPTYCFMRYTHIPHTYTTHHTSTENIFNKGLHLFPRQMGHFFAGMSNRVQHQTRNQTPRKQGAFDFVFYVHLKQYDLMCAKYFWPLPIQLILPNDYWSKSENIAKCSIGIFLKNRNYCQMQYC